MKKNLYITGVLIFIMSFGYAMMNWVATKNANPTPTADLLKEPETVVNTRNSVDSFPTELKYDLAKINKAHSLLDNIKITNRYVQLSTLQDNTEAMEESEFSLCRMGAKLFYDAGSIKRIQNEKYNVLVNDDVNMIMVFDPEKNLGTLMKEALKNFDADSSLLWADKAEKIETSKGNTAYSIYFSVMPYSRLDMDFNSTTHLLNSITYYFDNFEEEDDYKKQKVTIFINYKKLDKTSISLFDTRKYFSSKKDELTISENFTGYELYNNMKK